MAWVYDYGVRFDSEGTATTFATEIDNVRIMPEVSAGLRGRPVDIAHQHGSTLNGRVPYAAFGFILEVTLSYGTPETPADVYQNRSTVLQRLTHHLEPVWVTRTAPHQGTVEIPVRVLRSVQTGNPRHRLLFPCRTLDPFWRDTTLTFNSVNVASGITHSGDAPIADGVFYFSGVNGTHRVTDITVGGPGGWIEINGDSTVTPFKVDVGLMKVTQGGTDVDSVMTARDPWLLEIHPGTNTYSVTGGGTVSFDGRTKWL